jgi:hypothetical protein
MQCKLSPPIKSIRRKAPGTEDDRSRDRGAGLRGGGGFPLGTAEGSGANEGICAGGRSLLILRY